MENLSFEGLEVGSKEYRRMASRRYYHRNKEQEKARATSWRKANPEKYQDWAEKNKEKRAEACRKYDHQVTPEWFENQMKEQDGKCAICQQPLSRPDIDHDHACCPTRKSCGKCNRGLLCRSCNTFIGLAQESVEVLQNAIEYLKKYQFLKLKDS